MVDLKSFYSADTKLFLSSHGLFENATQSQLNKAIETLSLAQQADALKRMGHTAQVDNLRAQTKEARRLEKEGQKGLRRTMRRIGFQTFWDGLKSFSYGETSTTHPLQIATAREEYLRTAYSKRETRRLELTEKLKNATDATKTHLLRQLEKTSAQLARIEGKLARVPSQNEKAVSAIQEAKLKLPYTKNAALGWADTNTYLKKIVFEKTARVYEGLVSHFASWVGLDNDRNKVLKAEDAFNTARMKHEAAFQLHARALGKAARQTKDKALAAELSALRRTLLNTAQNAGYRLPFLDAYAQAGRFKDAEDYSAALRTLRNDPRFSRQRWRIEKLVSLADGAGFHLVEGEARQNAQALDDVLKLIYRKQKLAMPSRASKNVDADMRLFNDLADRLDTLKKIDLVDADFNDIKDPARRMEAKKLIDCLKEYKKARDAFGDKALSRIVIAEARSPSQVLAMRMLCEKFGLLDSNGNGLKIIPLVESSKDKWFIREFLQKAQDRVIMSKPGAKAISAFLKSLEIMQAASDTLRVNGQNYGLRAIHWLGNYLEKAGAFLYWGIGTDPQRTGGILPHRIVNYLMSGVKHFRQTVQGSDVQLVYRTPSVAAGHSMATLNAFLKNAFALDKSEIYKLHDPAIQVWAKASQNSHRRLVTGAKAAINDVINSLMPTKIVPAFNTGSRAGIGLFGKAYNSLSAFKDVVYHNARAISLAFGGKASGLNATTVGMGHALKRAMRDDPAILSKLHGAYRDVPGFRLMVDSTTRAVAYGNHEAVRSSFADTLRTKPSVSRWFEYHARDSTFLKSHLPQIIHGVGTTIGFDELPHVKQALGNPFFARVTQTILNRNLSEVLAASGNAPLKGTRLGKAFKLMQLGASALTRITGRFA